jgi:hypothetical protein
MVASRCAQRLNLRAAACNRSTSAAVRYSRVLTEEFTMVGASLSTSDLSAVLALTVGVTSELSIVPSLVSIGAVGIHGQPWPGVSRPVWPQRAVSSEP